MPEDAATMSSTGLIAALLLAGFMPQPDSEPLTAEAIMARVAANQDRSDQVRSE